MEKHATLQEYFECFKNNVNVLEHIGAIIGPHPYLVAQEFEYLNQDDFPNKYIDEEGKVYKTITFKNGEEID